MLSRQVKIGLIGGVSWVSTQEYYRRINTFFESRLGAHHTPGIVLYSLPFDAVLEHQESGDPEDRGQVDQPEDFDVPKFRGGSSQDPMEDEPVEVAFLGKLDEVAGRLGRDVGEQLGGDRSVIGFDGDGGVGQDSLRSREWKRTVPSGSGCVHSWWAPRCRG